MESPPPYMPPRKKSNTGLIIGLVLGGIAICCIGGIAIMFFGGFYLFKNVAPMAECAMNYEFVDQALKKYVAEHDGKLPAAATWQDDLAKYVEAETKAPKNEGNPFKLIDAHGDWGCTSGDRKTGMAFNSDLAGKTLADAMKDDAVIIFESDKTGRNLVQKYERQSKSTSPQMMGKPRGWITINGSSGMNMDDKAMGGRFNVRTGND